MVALVSSSPCTSNLLIQTLRTHHQWHPNCSPSSQHITPLPPSPITRKGHQSKTKLRRRPNVLAVTEGSAKKSTESKEESIPSWARPDSDTPPPWARGEAAQKASQQSFEVPFYVYLLSSAVVAIAAIGSIFEYVNQKPVFGVLNSDSIFYAPLLGFFVFTGIPTSAFLWFKSVQAANKEAEEQDRRDGYM